MLDVAGSDATFEFEVSAWISLTMSSIYGFHTLFLTLVQCEKQGESAFTQTGVSN